MSSERYIDEIKELSPLALEKIEFSIKYEIAYRMYRARFNMQDIAFVTEIP